MVMVTGDHPATALAVAHEVGIRPSRVLTGLELETMPAEALSEAVKEANVFARVAPEHKLRLVEALKQNGEIVAMTGDGVNDAPALKRSDVGVAMGERGSDVSREVADLVLMDDNFATIVAAIEEGRNIYENIQKFIRPLLDQPGRNPDRSGRRVRRGVDGIARRDWRDPAAADGRATALGQHRHGRPAGAGVGVG